MAPAVVELVERDGVDQRDERWAVPWLRGLRRVPQDATWPRLMTVPHPDAVDSLGAGFVRWAQAREGRPLRWFQRLVATRLLEVNAAGELVWGTLILTMARQLGKSWLLRELILWRLHQADRFGEPQDVIHTGKDLKVCQDVQRWATPWAQARAGEYKVTVANGKEQLEHLPSRSRWMLRAKGAPYGSSVSVAAVDEAWNVAPELLDDGLAPTMVARNQPQLWLISTAHREATALMLRRRARALDHLEDGDSDLLIEWSAPRSMPVDDVDGWRLASPWWTAQRERHIREQLENMRAGQVVEHAEGEMDPEQSFRAQWLNQWPRRQHIQADNSEPLLPQSMWDELQQPLTLAGDEPVFVAVEDKFGTGASVAAVAVLEDDRLVVEAWGCDDWDDAISDVSGLAGFRRIQGLQVGASMLDRLPPDGPFARAKPAGTTETRLGLALFRDLAANGVLVHDDTTAELDEALAQARVRPTASGLQLDTRLDKAHVVKAAVWAVAAAHKPARIIAVR